MPLEPKTDPLELWRGIDDAVWREALRTVPPAAIQVPKPASADRNVVRLTAQPAARCLPKQA